ncbi:PhoX family phosphatase [Roseomonas sp. KE2513]|uniref:PhoX family protein n=1 Tax=Roseomonas sp. KE2513 TaxID=2479202 RepID=UPI001E39BAD3|nr:PhoX family phosphatase [Roseomonas sp. KE2513]
MQGSDGRSAVGAAMPCDAAMPRDIEDIGSNPVPVDPIRQVLGRRLARRAALRGLIGATFAGVAAQSWAQGVNAGVRGAGASTLGFRGLPHGTGPGEAVAEGHEVQVVIRWGDPVLPGAPAFDPANQTAAAQAMQFGYNNDYLDFFPLPKGGEGEHGLLVVNHEYTNPELMFAGLGDARAARLGTSAAQVATEMMAHGASVVEIRREGERWAPVAGSALNRRITAETPIRVSGPAAGHERLRTSADPTGALVRGTLNNCAGGNTPWGTVLIAEENFNYYFGGPGVETGAQAASYKRYGLVRDAQFPWGRHVPRFDVASEPNEPNRFGWVVEFDPYDPESIPVKRTALGRFKHEGCTHAVSADGRVVIYMGDDERFDYVYRFVTARPFDREDPARNRDLLDEGTLSVARFGDDGTVTWLPLVHGEGPLTEANGFHSQGDVVIEARRAADLLGATPMDRPEDVQANPVNGRVYVMLTNNGSRTATRTDKANPRANNIHGHVIEIVPPRARGGVDHAAPTARWETFLMAGRPGSDPGASYHRAVGADSGWLSCPDNCAFDSKGRIWIATDGAPAAADVADGLYAADTEGEGRALTRRFYAAPTGAEVCGPLIGPGDRTVFLAIQHPGEERGSTYDKPSTRWPDYAEGMPPRPSIIAIIRKDGGTVGS